MERFLWRRDLPSFFFFWANNVDDPYFQFVLKELPQTAQTNGLILNTFEDLEWPILSQIRNHWPKTYAIRPLHEHWKSRLASEMTVTIFQQFMGRRQKLHSMASPPTVKICYLCKLRKPRGHKKRMSSLTSDGDQAAILIIKRVFFFSDTTQVSFRFR